MNSKSPYNFRWSVTVASGFWIDCGIASKLPRRSIHGDTWIYGYDQHCILFSPRSTGLGFEIKIFFSRHTIVMRIYENRARMLIQNSWTLCSIWETNWRCYRWRNCLWNPLPLPSKCEEVIRLLRTFDSSGFNFWILNFRKVKSMRTIFKKTSTISWLSKHKRTQQLLCSSREKTKLRFVPVLFPCFLFNKRLETNKNIRKIIAVVRNRR